MTTQLGAHIVSCAEDRVFDPRQPALQYMLNDSVSREHVIAAAETLMKSHGYSHGPCLAARQLVSKPVPVWEIEWAYKDHTGPSSTADPATIVIEVSIDGDDIRFLEPWWNRQRE